MATKDFQEHQHRLEAAVKADAVYPTERFKGRGIVICAGGIKYFTNAFICASMLRQHGCQLPIQFWHLGEKEMSPEMKDLVKPLDVQVIDGYEVRKSYPARILNGWELKPFSIIHSPFAEVISLDADNVPVRDPEFLFDTTPYKDSGAVFWPDYGRFGPKHVIWSIMDVPYRNEPEFESAQIVVDKFRCWKALSITMLLNEWSDFYYHHIHGDKDTFHMAWRKLDQPYAMPNKAVRSLDGCVMLQHDFEGKPLFQHRNGRKWSLKGDNPSIRNFVFEKECLDVLNQLRDSWSVARQPQMADSEKLLAHQIASQRRYLYVRVGHDYREMELEPGGTIGKGSRALERLWSVVTVNGERIVRIEGDASVICDLKRDHNGILHGNWLQFEKMPVRLLPLRRS